MVFEITEQNFDVLAGQGLPALILFGSSDSPTFRRYKQKLEDISNNIFDRIGKLPLVFGWCEWKENIDLALKYCQGIPNIVAFNSPAKVIPLDEIEKVIEKILR